MSRKSYASKAWHRQFIDSFCVVLEMLEGVSVWVESFSDKVALGKSSAAEGIFFDMVWHNSGWSLEHCPLPKKWNQNFLEESWAFVCTKCRALDFTLRPSGSTRGVREPGIAVLASKCGPLKVSHFDLVKHEGSTQFKWET